MFTKIKNFVNDSNNKHIVKQCAIAAAISNPAVLLVSLPVSFAAGIVEGIKYEVARKASTEQVVE